MAQSYNPYFYQGNNLLNMLDLEKFKKNRLMETPITAAEAESMSNPFMQVNKVEPTLDYTASGTQGNPAAGIGEVGYINPLGQVEQTSPTGKPLRPSVGMGKDFTGYTKSLDKTFAMAALQSAVPQNDQTSVSQAPSGGGRGGGNRMDQMTPYTSAIPLDDEKYPMLWRYS